MVSKAFRDLVEAMDPAEHTFVPIEIARLDGEVWTDTHFILKLGGFIDNGIIVEQSDVNLWIRKGVVKRCNPTAQRPRLMWRASAIAGRHIWADRLFAEAVVVSDEFHAALKARKMGGFTALESRVDPSV